MVFFVPHQQAVVIFGKAFKNQGGLKLWTIDARSVLKFIYHDVFQLRARYFVNKGSVAVAYDCFHQDGRVRKQKTVLFPVDGPDFEGNVGEQADFVDVFKAEVTGMIDGIEFGPLSLAFLQKWYQRTFGQLYYFGSPGVLGCGPFFGICKGF